MLEFALEFTDLVAVIDPNEEQGRKIANMYDTNWVKNFREIPKNVEAAVIATPTEYHLEVALDVAKRGVNFLVEKPLALNCEEAKIVEAATKNNVIMTTGHIERFNPVISYAKRSLDNGNWGDIVSLSSRRLSMHPERIRDVGVIFDLAIHDLDILSYLANSSVSKVHSIGSSYMHSDFEDHAMVIIEFKNLIKASSEVSWLTPFKVRKLDLTCERAYVSLDFANQKVIVRSSNYDNTQKINSYEIGSNISTKEPSIVKEEPLKLELFNFFESVISNGKVLPLVSNKEAVDAVKLAQEITEQLKK